ncbi:MAG: hypothetical protein M1838_000913 [Thelocarpon superellum]|nr:MAG: hypothetical protein M1838_000913 [Thelocarpon superellum]
MQKLKARLSRHAGNDESDDSPQGSASRGVRSFCESGGSNNAEEEVLHLPAIVDAAESSPVAAREAALQIRKYLGRDYVVRSSVQYNAIMLVRILADNPGRTFTRSFDSKFVSTVKDLLRQSPDPSVQQILRETLDTFAREKNDDEGLKALTEMWLREKEKAPADAVSPLSSPCSRKSLTPRQRSNASTPRMMPVGAAGGPQPPHNYFARNHKNHKLPPPHELVSRIEEAKTSANLLLQVVQSTPTSEVLQNDLIAEFAQRCASASQSIQSYIHSDDPTPDDDTLLTLIETNEQLSLAMSRHQRAVLQARKLQVTRPASEAASAGEGSHASDPFADTIQHAPDASHPYLRTAPDEGDSNSYQPQQPPHDDMYGVEDNYASGTSAPPVPGFTDDQSRMPRRDDSFRITLPPPSRLTEASEEPAPAENDPRWSWSQRMSTQAGYGPRESSPVRSNAAPSSANSTKMRQGPSDLRHSVFSRASSLFQRQRSAVANTTMRGGAGAGPAPAADPSVSPVSPLEARPTVTGHL